MRASTMCRKVTWVRTRPTRRGEGEEEPHEGAPLVHAARARSAQGSPP